MAEESWRRSWWLLVWRGLWQGAGSLGDRDAFDDQLCSLVEEVHKVLTALEGSGAETASEPEADQTRSVFLMRRYERCRY